jgi:hypothetical protein
MQSLDEAVDDSLYQRRKDEESLMLTCHPLAELMHVPVSRLVSLQDAADTTTTPTPTATSHANVESMMPVSVFSIGFVGLGAVRYVPSYVDAQAAMFAPWVLDERVRKDVDRLNQLLCEEMMMMMMRSVKVEKESGGGESASAGLRGVQFARGLFVVKYGEVGDGEKGEIEEAGNVGESLLCLKIGLVSYLFFFFFFFFLLIIIWNTSLLIVALCAVLYIG